MLYLLLDLYYCNHLSTCLFSLKFARRKSPNQLTACCFESKAMPLIASAAAAVLHNPKPDRSNHQQPHRKDEAMNSITELTARYEAALAAGNLELASDLASEIMSIEDSAK